QAAAGGPRAALGAVLGTLLGGALAVAACWPLAPADPDVRSTLDSGARSSSGTAMAVRALRPLVGAPGSVVAVSGPQRYRVALELGLPLPRVRDLFLATLTQPLEQALSGTVAVFHDDGLDRPRSRFAPLERAAPERVGGLRVSPLLADPGRGVWVFDVGVARDPPD
ncbi:MAG TPA: hypothetical protein VFA46_19120, partial [Actinomycetes bacterium]|nr:hypothetical protein [Actinomycetes bacterium]